MTASEEIEAWVVGCSYLSNPLEEFRRGGIPTGLPCESRPDESMVPRSYQCKSVARIVPSGRWIGWTYWFDGGMHGEPSGIPWLEFAYYVETTAHYVETKEGMMPVVKFAKV